MPELYITTKMNKLFQLHMDAGEGIPKLARKQAALKFWANPVRGVTPTENI